VSGPSGAPVFGNPPIHKNKSSSTRPGLFIPSYPNWSPNMYYASPMISPTNVLPANAVGNVAYPHPHPPRPHAHLSTGLAYYSNGGAPIMTTPSSTPLGPNGYERSMHFYANDYFPRMELNGIESAERS